jgi:release factor glutamine methyltransferase
VSIPFQSVDFVELRWLLEEKYRLSRAQAIELVEQFRADGSIAPEYLQDVQMLAEGVPVAYVIGWSDFLGCHIDLSLRPLIPRPETEFWVEQCIAANLTIQRQQPLRVLDLCCGSGCIGIAILKHLPNTHVTFVDIDPQMIEQTLLNIELNTSTAHISEQRYAVVQSDLFSGVHGDFDVILTNPPYVSEFGEFSPTLKHEPAHALFAQKEGLAVIEQIFLTAKNHLNPNGELYVEFAADQAERVQQLGRDTGWRVRVFEDHFARDRYAICTPE